MYIKKLKQLPWTLILLINLICLYGIIALYYAAGEASMTRVYMQITVWLLFFPISILISLIDIRKIYHLSYYPYLIAIFLLIAVKLFGATAMGSKRWFDLGGFKMQPSEPVKIALVFFLAKYFNDLNANVAKIRNLILPILIITMPSLIVISQPDLGTGIIIISIGIAILFAVGVPLKYFMVMSISVICAAPIMWQFLYEYQRKRILVFLNPDMDPQGAGYNIIQSKIAIGSGGFLGKGLGKGSQSNLQFLPEHQTDFIFSSLAEEVGFVGTFSLMLLYMTVIYISLTIAINARSVYAKIMVIGVTSILFTHIFVNIAMALGLLPAVGIPLPFVSYGGTMLASILCSYGLVYNVHLNRNINIK